MQVFVAYSSGDTSETEVTAHVAQPAVAELVRKVNVGTVRWFAVVGAGQGATVDEFGAILDKN